MFVNKKKLQIAKNTYMMYLDIYKCVHNVLLVFILTTILATKDLLSFVINTKVKNLNVKNVNKVIKK